MSSQIVLIFGSGPNIGASTIRTFHDNGYRVAYSSRSANSKDNDESILALKCDLSNPQNVETAFETVRKTWGEPHHVVYNGYATQQTQPKDSFNIPTETFEEHLAINTTSTFVAIREALAGFTKMTGSRTFLFTGNMTNEGVVPGLLTLAIGKAASAYMIEMADSVYRNEDIRFHFVDERTTEGKGMFVGLGGQAHADMFLDLVERKSKLPWQVTFVNGEGYKSFPHELIM